MTATNFCIVLTEGLAPAPIAAELLKQLPSYAPTLVSYLDQCQSNLTSINLNQAKCTAFEAWQLQQAGLPASMAKHNAALALLLADEQQKLTSLTPEQPFWLVELVHISPARDGAALLAADHLAIDVSQNTALLESAQSLCDGTPFSLSPWSNTHWQLHVDSNLELPDTFASTALISRTSLSNWWDQDERSRAWRRLVNEIQMLFFDHPTNHSRQAQGLVAINSLWPVGGLCPDRWQPKHNTATIFDALTEPYLRQEWGQWLQNLQSIDQRIAEQLKKEGPKPRIILTNTTHYLEAAHKPPRFWHHLFKFNSTPIWRNHWLGQS